MDSKVTFLLSLVVFLCTDGQVYPRFRTLNRGRHILRRPRFFTTTIPPSRIFRAHFTPPRPRHVQWVPWGPLCLSCPRPDFNPWERIRLDRARLGARLGAQG